MGVEKLLELGLRREEVFLLDSIAWNLGILNGDYDISCLKEIPSCLWYIVNIARLYKNNNLYNDSLYPLRRFDERFGFLNKRNNLIKNLIDFYWNFQRNPNKETFDKLLEKYFPLK